MKTISKRVILVTIVCLFILITGVAVEMKLRDFAWSTGLIATLLFCIAPVLTENDI
jgi:hypothetical protein